MSKLANWRLPAGVTNAHALQANYGEGFAAIAELDRMGHLMLHRIGSKTDAASLEQVVGIALLRRAVTIFTAIRTLLEGSLADPSRALARAHFEIWLNYRCIAYGSRRIISLESSTAAAERNPRANRFFVASERRGLRSRAMIIQPGSRHKPKTVEERDLLEKEMADELYRLREHFGPEWAFFGDCPPDATAISETVSRDPLWFAGEWPDNSVSNIAQLARAYDYHWEYDYIYDAFSALVHARGIRHDVSFDERQMGVRHPNDDSWFTTVAYYSVTWQLMLLMTAAKWHDPGTIPELQSLHTRLRAGINSLEPKDAPPLLS